MTGDAVSQKLVGMAASDAAEFYQACIDASAEIISKSGKSLYMPNPASAEEAAKNYQAICDNCVRFAPVIYGPEQMRGMHGVNENIETACLPGAVDFYKALIGKNR